MSKNRYTRALKHLKNKTIDEKLELLTELPTNHTTGLYVDVPGGEVTPPPVPGPIDAPADYSQDGDGSPGYEGKDTTGLFMTDGTIKTVEPPGDTSYILGPMSSMWYAWANYTQIGYIRQEDRKMVNLGRITGQLDDWDEVSGFTAYGQLTLEQAVWFKNITRINDYRAFYPGPPSSVADEYGRYICSITGESKPAERQPPTNFEPGTQRGGNPEDDLSLLSQEEERRRADERNRLILNAVMLGLDIAAVIALLFPEPASTAAGAARLASKLRYASKVGQALNKFNPFKTAKSWWNKGRNTRIPNENRASWRDLMRDDLAQRGQSDASFAAGRKPNLLGRPDQAFNPFRPASKGGPGSGPTPAVRQAFERPVRAVRDNPRTAAATAGIAGGAAGGRSSKKKVKEGYEYIFEAAPTGSGAEGGADIADAYVDGVSQKASPEELEQASNDANAIAKQGGQGLSDSELAKIDKQAEAEAKRLTNLNFDRPNSMSNEELSSTLNLIYDADPDWLDDTVEKFDHLLPTDEIKELEKEYEERESELETTREDIKSQIEEIESQYNDKGGSWDQGGLRVYGDANWGGQFTPQNFESSGQSFEEYEGLRAQLGFFNGNDGPDEYGRYIPLSWRHIMDAPDNGYTPEQFTGVAREIVEASYRLIEIESNPNFPRPGRNIYHSEEDYNEALALQNEHGPLMSKYVQLWEGPGGYDDLAKKLYDYNERSKEMMKEAAYKAAKEKEQLKSKLDNLEGDLDKEYQEDYYDLFRPFLIRLIEEWNNSIGQDYDPYSLEDINPADFASMSEEEKKKLRETLMKLGISYGDIASADALDLTSEAIAAVLGLGITGLVGLYNITADAAINFINAVSTSNPAVPPSGETSQQAREREAAEKKLADAEAQYGPDSDEAAEARRERSDTLSRHKKERRGETGSTSGDARRKKEAEQEAAKKAREERLRRNQEATNRENEEKIRRQKQRERRGRQRTSEDEIGDLLRGETYNPPKFLKNRERKSITEVGVPNQKRILREIKKPVVIDEGPTKFKVKPTGRKNKSVGSTMMNKVETPLTYKPVNNIWSKKDKARNIRASQERKNQVLELVGAAEHHWTYLTEDRRKKRQEKVNEMMSAEFDKSLELMYENYKKSIDGKAEKLVNKIRTKVKPEYPKTPPPQLDPETGMHPKYGKKYKHDKLDPHSAESMPPTGDPVIDANAKKAHDPVQKARKLKILRGKSIKEETNWSKVSNRIKKLTESDWSPVDTGRPTNSTTQTFEYGGEGGPRFTANGLGGQDVYPQTIDFFGDQIPTPSYSNLALQGYTPPLGKGVMKRDKDAEEFRKKQDENLQNIKDTLESLGTSWEEMRANNWALVKPDGTSIMLEPITPGNKQLNWIDNSKITVGKKHRNAGPNQNPFKVRNPDGSITIEFSEIKSVKKFEIGERPSVNAQLDASQDYTVEIDADAFMGGRVDGESPDTPTFADTGPDAPSPFRGHGSQYGPLPHEPFTPSTNPNITPEDEAFIDYMERYPNFVNSLFPGQAAAATSVINYARGNYSDITQSPGRSANQTILNIISRVHKPGQRGGTVTQGQNLGGPPSNINTAYPTDPINAVLDAPMRNFLNQFDYEVTSDGPRITDTFNFNDNRNTGAIGNIRIKGPDGNAIKIQDIADRLADIGDRRARSMGLDPASDSFGGKIDFTIPWNEVPAELQNQLDPTATIIPTTKRKRKGKSKSKTFENFDNLSKKKIYKDIAIKETKYLRYFIENSSVPKHYDWESGEFNELAEINRVVLKRLETIENALSEGMTTKDFKYLYGGVITNDIVSLNPNLVSSTFAHDLISTSSEVTSHMFGPDFPGSHINSIGDFNPQSYSKVDVVATASWNSIQDVTPSGWTPENSYDYVDSVSDVVTPGQESDVFKDTLFGEVTVNGTNFSLSTGDDEDSSQENTVDILDLRTLFPGVTFPTGHPTPGQEDVEPPIEASMLLRTFKSIKVGQEITFNYSFTSTETEDGDPVTYRGVPDTGVPGDDNNMDDYAFVLIAGKVQKIVSVLARDGNNLDFNFQPDVDDYYKPDVLQSRFPLTGKYSYTVKQDDIDDYGNLKLFVGVMDAGDGAYESNLDVTNFQLDSSRLAAGQLGQTTDAYNLGTSVASLDPNNKKKKKDRKEDRKKKKNTFAKRWGLPDDYLDRFRRAHAYYINNIGKISVPMGLGFGTMGVAEKVDELFDKSLAKQGFSEKQIETIKKNKLLKFTSKKVKGAYDRTVERWKKEREEYEKRRQQEYDRRPKIGAKLTSIRDITSPEKREMLRKVLAGTNIPYDKSRFTTPKKQSKGSSGEKLEKGTRGIQAPSQKQFTLSDKGDLSKNLNDKYGYKTTEKDKWMDNYAAKVARGEEPVPPVPRGNAAADPIGDLMTVGPVAAAAAKALIGTVGIAAGSAITKGARVLDQFVKWWNKGKNARVGNEDTSSLWDLFTDDLSQLTRSDAAFKSGQTGLKTLRPFKSVLDPKMRATGPTPLIRQGGRVLTKPLGPTLGARNESYDLILEQVDPDDKFFQELQKVIVKLKKPEQVEKLSKFLKKVAKAKEKSELRTAGENNSNELYPGQPSPNGFPDTPPPKLAPNGYHPEFGKKADRYRRLDPISAKTMDRVKTGDPETDAQVSAAAKSVFKRFKKYR